MLRFEVYHNLLTLHKDRVRRRHKAICATLNFARQSQKVVVSNRTLLRINAKVSSQRDVSPSDPASRSIERRLQSYHIAPHNAITLFPHPPQPRLGSLRTAFPPNANRPRPDRGADTPVFPIFTKKVGIPLPHPLEPSLGCVRTEIGVNAVRRHLEGG